MKGLPRLAIRIASLKGTVLAALLMAPRTEAQLYKGQKPPPLRTRAAIDSILGPKTGIGLERNIRVCLVWGYDNHSHDPVKKDHPPGAHEFRMFTELMAQLLAKVPGVTVEKAFYFPSPAQWESADVMFLNLAPDAWADSQFAYLDRFQARGGGMLVIGEPVIMYGNKGQAWADRIGYAWSEGTSKWGPLPLPQKANTALGHLILKGFPAELDFQDELYWNLKTSTKGTLTVLVSSQAGAEGSVPPLSPSQMDSRQWPVVWAYEKGKGRVVATPLTHNFWTFKDDPYFRILLFRALAWTAGVSFEPFRSLPSEGVTLKSDPVSVARRSSPEKSRVGTVPGFSIETWHAGLWRRLDGKHSNGHALGLKSERD